MIERESETEKINQERGGEIERGKAIELSAVDRTSGGERENGENVVDQKRLVQFHLPLNPNNQARIDMSQQPNLSQ